MGGDDSTEPKVIEPSTDPATKKPAETTENAKEDPVTEKATETTEMSKEDPAIAKPAETTETAETAQQDPVSTKPAESTETPDTAQKDPASTKPEETKEITKEDPATTRPEETKETAKEDPATSDTKEKTETAEAAQEGTATTKPAETAETLQEDPVSTQPAETVKPTKDDLATTQPAETAGAAHEDPATAQPEEISETLQEGSTPLCNVSGCLQIMIVLVPKADSLGGVGPRCAQHAAPPAESATLVAKADQKQENENARINDERERNAMPKHPGGRVLVKIKKEEIGVRPQCTVKKCKDKSKGDPIGWSDDFGGPGYRCEKHGGYDQCGVESCDNPQWIIGAKADAWGKRGSRCYDHSLPLPPSLLKELGRKSQQLPNSNKDVMSTIVHGASNGGPAIPHDTIAHEKTLAMNDPHHHAAAGDDPRPLRHSTNTPVERAANKYPKRQASKSKPLIGGSLGKSMKKNIAPKRPKKPANAHVDNAAKNVAPAKTTNVPPPPHAAANNKLDAKTPTTEELRLALKQKWMEEYKYQQEMEEKATERQHCQQRAHGTTMKAGGQCKQEGAPSSSRGDVPPSGTPVMRHKDGGFSQGDDHNNNSKLGRATAKVDHNAQGRSRRKRGRMEPTKEEEKQVFSHGGNNIPFGPYLPPDMATGSLVAAHRIKPKKGKKEISQEEEEEEEEKEEEEGNNPTNTTGPGQKKRKVPPVVRAGAGGGKRKRAKKEEHTSPSIVGGATVKAPAAGGVIVKSPASAPAAAKQNPHKAKKRAGAESVRETVSDTPPRKTRVGKKAVELAPRVSSKSKWCDRQDAPAPSCNSAVPPHVIPTTPTRCNVLNCSNDSSGAPILCTDLFGEPGPRCATHGGIISCVVLHCIRPMFTYAGKGNKYGGKGPRCAGHSSASATKNQLKKVQESGLLLPMMEGDLDIMMPTNEEDEEDEKKMKAKKARGKRSKKEGGGDARNKKKKSGKMKKASVRVKREGGRQKLTPLVMKRGRPGKA